MDDNRFLYFSKLIKYSITNQTFLFIIKLIELFPILIDFLSNSLRVKYYFQKIEKSYSSSHFKDSIFKKIISYSFFRKFRELRDSNDLYSFYLIIIEMLILVFYNIFFFLLFIFKKLRNKNNERIKKRNRISSLIKMILINFYDHFVFRCFSIFFYDIIICYLCKSKSYIVLIIMSFLFFYIIYLNLDYFSSFRLCIKFDLNNKYIYDEKFILAGDYCLTFLKISISFEYNIDDEKICHFFDLLILLICIIGTIKFFKEPTYNIIGILYGFFFICFLNLFILNIIFLSITIETYLFVIYTLLSLLIPLIITYKIMKKKYNILIRTPMEDSNKQNIQQFELLYEYYQTPYFDNLLRNICFNNKIRDNEIKYLISKNSTIVGEEETIIMNDNTPKKSIIKSINSNTKDIKKELNYIVLNKLSMLFKENSTHPNNDKNLNLFYYIISKIFMELLTDLNNYFQLIFEIRKILNKLKFTNYIYYINLRYYYQILCEKHSINDNMDMLLYNETLFKIFNVIVNFIDDMEKFLSNDFIKNPIDFTSISVKVAKSETILKNSYQYIITSPIKNEYQKLLLRIILESLFNKIFSLSGMMLISSDIGMYEEVLDKCYNNEKILKIKVDLINRTSQIIKIGKDLNIYWYKSFDNLIPPEFQKIGTDKFFNDEIQIETNKTKISPQKFHFIVWNKDHDLKQFVYEYGIYPKLEENIAYVDGTYKLGKDILIVTKKYIHSEKEFIFTLSNSLEKIMYINKSLLSILKRYDILIEINDFLQDENTYMYDLTKYCSYIYEKIKKLETMCNPEEIKLINQLIEHLNESTLLRSKRMRYQFIYLFSVFDKDYEYCFYSIKQFKNKNKGIKIRKEKSIVNWQLKDEDFQSASKDNKNKDENKNITNFNTIYSSFAFDTKSQASQQSVSSTLFSVNTSVGRKKIDPQNNNQNRNYIIIIFNIILIIVSFFCLVFENIQNIRLEKKMNLYRKTSVFNRFILNLMVSYLSLLKICDENDNCNQYLFNYISKFESFNELNELIKYELQLKLTEITPLFNELKTYIEKSGVKEIKKYSNVLKNEIYLSYIDGNLVLNKLIPVRFDYLMKTFINKLIMTTNDDNFINAKIYKIKVDENYNPIEIMNNNSNIKFNENQIFIYEILISYLDYSNHYYSLQVEIDDNSDKQLKFNFVSLIIFIIALIVLNIFIMLTCLLLLNYFHKIIDKLISMMETLLRNQINVDKLCERISLLKDLIKFYYKPPMEVLTKLSDNMRKNEKKKHKNEEMNQQIQNSNEDLIGNYSLFFIMKKFIIIICAMTFIFIFYCIIFIKISYNSINSLKNIIKIMENSSYDENLTYFMIGVIQLLQYINIPDISLYNTFYSIFKNKTIDLKVSDFFTDLYNYQQEIYLLERREKQVDKNLIDSEIITFNCSSFFQFINNRRFNYVIDNHPDKNYLEQMINFCNHINVMIYANEEIYMDNLYYSILKLLLLNSHLIHEFPKYPMEELSELTLQILVIYQPLKLYLGNYYLETVLKKKLDIHFYTVLLFLLGNIIMEIIFFILIKFLIIDHIDETNKNLNKLLRILKVI